MNSKNSNQNPFNNSLRSSSSSMSPPQNSPRSSQQQSFGSQNNNIQPLSPFGSQNSNSTSSAQQPSFGPPNNNMQPPTLFGPHNNNNNHMQQPFQLPRRDYTGRFPTAIGSQGDHMFSHSFAEQANNAHVQNIMQTEPSTNQAEAMLLNIGMQQSMMEDTEMTPVNQETTQFLQSGAQELENSSLLPQTRSRTNRQHQVHSAMNAQMYPTTEFGGPGQGEGHALRRLRQSEQQQSSNNPPPINQQQTMQSINTLVDTDAVHQADEILSSHTSPDMQHSVSQMVGFHANNLFPNTTNAMGGQNNIANNNNDYLNRGGNPNKDPDYEYKEN